jgi:predicted RNA binding protein YcfA (HicA-like mRNA interferase family)
MTLRIPEPYRALAKLARRLGWTVSSTRNSHLRWRRPDGHVVITAGSPSDHRGIRNDKVRLRKAGLNERNAA